jgi:hypothetical protein
MIAWCREKMRSTNPVASCRTYADIHLTAEAKIESCRCHCYCCRCLLLPLLLPPLGGSSDIIPVSEVLTVHADGRLPCMLEVHIAGADCRFPGWPAEPETAIMGGAQQHSCYHGTSAMKHIAGVLALLATAVSARLHMYGV